MKKVIVVAVHPDDETLMCGGTLLKHKHQGDQIYWLIVTNMSTKHGWGKELVERRQQEISKVSKMYGFKKTFKLDFPTTKLDEIPISDIISAISKVFNEVKPNIVYLPNRSDVHTDHQIVFKAAYSCTKNFRYPFIKKTYMGETLSETEFAPALYETAFIPNTFVDITECFDKKIEILNVFATEVMESPLPRSSNTIEALARYRGSTISVKYAESFVLLKEIL